MKTTTLVNPRVRCTLCRKTYKNLKTAQRYSKHCQHRTIQFLLGTPEELGIANGECIKILIKQDNLK